ncbi:MAG: PAS domain-containing protein [Candidatus Macondimonas sp.]
MRFPASTISVLPRLDPSRWFGLLALPALFAALALAWMSFSESLLRIAAPDPGVLPMLRMLNNLLFILLTTVFWTFWLVRQANANRRRETLWRTLLEQAPIPLVLARKGKVVACNPAFSGLLGHADPHALLDYPLLSRIPTEEQVALLGRLKGMDPRHPHTLRLEIRIQNTQNEAILMVAHVRRCLIGRSVYELVCCYPKKEMESMPALGAELGLQLLESLPRPLWLWTPQGLCLWRNQAACQENQAGIQHLTRRYGAFQEGRPIGSQAQLELMRPALEAEGSICVQLPPPTGRGKSAANLCVLSLRDGADQVQAVAALLEPGAQADLGAPAIPLLRSLQRIQQRLWENPAPEIGARMVLEALQLHLAPAGWVGLLQANLQTREAMLWSLSSAGELNQCQSYLPADLSTECGPPGWSDLASIQGLEALPPFLDRFEQAGIDRFERILPAAPEQGRRQVLLLSRRLPPEAELLRLWVNLVLDAWNQRPPGAHAFSESTGLQAR